MANNKKETKLGVANEAMRKAHSSELAKIMRLRAQSNANGVHANTADRRARTRSAAKSRAIKESL